MGTCDIPHRGNVESVQKGPACCLLNPQHDCVHRRNSREEILNERLMQLETKNAKRTGPDAIIPGFPRSSRQSQNW